MLENCILPPARDHYLSLPVVDGFTSYLARWLAGRVFDPPYLTQLHRPKIEYCFTSIQDAWEQYIQEPPNVKFEQTILECEEPLRKALYQFDDKGFIEIVKRMFATRENLAKSNLPTLEKTQYPCESILCAVRELSSDSPDVDTFGSVGGPRCTAFFSRIYATLIPNFLTYDSRIAAALCYFIREYCLSRGIALPEELRLGCVLGWGKNKKEMGRNPSWGDNTFLVFDLIKKRPLKERTFALSNYRASWLVADAISKAKKLDSRGSAWIGDPHAIHKVEGAFYMIGIEVPPYEANV